MTTTATERHRWPRRHALVLFWALTAPMVFQLTYTVMDGSSRWTDSTFAVVATYLVVQLGYVLALMGVVRVRRAYWAWVHSL